MDAGQTAPRRVAIVGGGAAGLAAALELRNVEVSSDGVKPLFEPVVFEQREQIGGIWQYEEPGQSCIFSFDHDSGVAHPLSTASSSSKPWPPGPMYPGLHTNIARDLMCFRDFPDRHWKGGNDDLFPDRDAIQTYIESFAQSHDLLQYVRLSTQVVSVKRNSSPDAAKSSWQVISKSVGSAPGTTASSEEFDFVIIANGRCNQPKVPFVPGLWLWQGELLHSAWYRTPVVFRGKSVLIVGNNSSGMDIARELHGKVVRHFDGVEEWVKDASAFPPRTGVRVRQSVEDVSKPPPMDYDPQDENSPEWSRAIEVVPRIARIEAPDSSSSSKGRIVLEDDTVLDDVDCIIFATGFYYSFPFLDQTIEPFQSAPVLQPPPPSSLTPEQKAELRQRYPSQNASEASSTPRVSPYMSNLDDWQLFYRHDPTIAFLGVPTSIVPFPFSQAQARYVAHFWAGAVPPLPHLDPDIPVSDATKWSSAVEPEHVQDRPHNDTRPVLHLLSHPSEGAYVDQLVQRIAGEARTSPVDKLPTDGRGVASAWGPEANYLTTKWRLERRVNGKLLRRQQLGY
ncbi:monooxygenase [Tilletia horrida]|uniref:Monooxygenase n=1 Tax=Tilletia horrida TaxID=155126 RepID=A0AAN6JP86_9BASI|nr:monooxygenase [Tilletia horrida]KAK0561261.1 monooxygenase [Tilletia horrida]